MPARLRAAARRPRTTRPVVALALVVAQCVGAFGLPVVRGTATVRACGCKVNGPNAGCCCKTGACCDVAPQPAPDEPACPKCVTKAKSPAKPQAAKAEKPAGVVWLSSAQSRQCRGESPLGLIADTPEMPPAHPARVGFPPAVGGIVRTANLTATSSTPVPPDRPPRRG